MTEIGEDLSFAQSSPPASASRRHRQVLAIACAIWLLAFLLHELPTGESRFAGCRNFPCPRPALRGAFRVALPRLWFDAIDHPSGRR